MIFILVILSVAKNLTKLVLVPLYPIVTSGSASTVRFNCPQAA
jgi:hypothetical protein